MLTVRQKMMLEFEAQQYKHIGVKEQTIRELFGVIPTHYYQELRTLIRDPRAVAYKPMLVSRLRDRMQCRRSYGASPLGVR